MIEIIQEGFVPDHLRQPPPGELNLAVGQTPEKKRHSRTGLLSVHGVDARERISDTKLSPWSMICSLILIGKDGGRGVGTGWMAGPRTVITAGHCLLSGKVGGWIESVIVIPGRTPSRCPFGEATLRHKDGVFDVLPAWRDLYRKSSDEKKAADIGVIHLNRPLGEKTGWLGFAKVGDERLQGHLANIAGYPGSVHGRETNGDQLWWHADAVSDLSDTVIGYVTDSGGGQSGAPVWIYENDGSKPIVAGVHAYGFSEGAVDEENSGPRITEEVGCAILDWINNGPSLKTS